MEHNPIARYLTTMAQNVSTVPPDRVTIGNLESIRADCRLVGGGADCDRQIAYECCANMGWIVACLTFLSEDGEVIVCGHNVCVLGDGTIVDPTRDQFGEGPAIRVVRPGDADYRRYRPEHRFGHEPGVNPLADEMALFTRSKWDGLYDVDVQHRLVWERGYDWWVGPDEREQLRSYLVAAIAQRPEAVSADVRARVEYLVYSPLHRDPERPMAEERLFAFDDPYMGP